jgi:hypothetical protein
MITIVVFGTKKLLARERNAVTFLVFSFSCIALEFNGFVTNECVILMGIDQKRWEGGSFYFQQVKKEISPPTPPVCLETGAHPQL